ncbi:hypothetical protein thsps117_15620 [Pseudomonas sp. No.117]
MECFGLLGFDGGTVSAQPRGLVCPHLGPLPEGEGVVGWSALGCWASTVEPSQPNLGDWFALTPALSLREREWLGGVLWVVGLRRWNRLSPTYGIGLPSPRPSPWGEGVWGG